MAKANITVFLINTLIEGIATMFNDDKFLFKMMPEDVLKKQCQI